MFGSFRFDLLSFLLGFAAAGIIAGVLYWLRGRLAQFRDRVSAQAGAARTFVTSGVEGRYRQSVFKFTQSAHLAGRIVALNEVFVAPRFMVQPPIPEPGADEQDLDLTYVVPRYADWPELAALYGAPAISLAELLQSPASLVVIGRPGAGKSTVLAHIAARLADDSQFLPGNPTPIFVHAADLEIPLDPASKKDVAEPLLLAAEACTGTVTGAGVAEHLNGRLKRGECLILLDGWDDLPAEHQADVVNWLRDFMAKYPGNRIVATGPAYGYAPLVGLGFAPVVLGSWMPEDFRALVNCWTAAWPQVVAKRKRKQTEEMADPGLIAGWLSGGTRGRTPLEVTLRIWTALEGDVIGPRPADWLAAYVARLLPSPDGLRALERLALESLSENRCGLGLDRIREHVNAALAASTARLPMDPADFVEIVLERGGLLVRRARNRASLSHPVVAAYLAASPFAAANKPEPFVGKNGYLFEPVFPFYASLGDATPFVAERLQKQPDALFADLIAMGRWLADTPSNARWRGEAFKRLAAIFLGSDRPELLRGRALSALVGARDETVNQLFKQALGSSDPVARTFAALGLGVAGDPANVAALAEKLADPVHPVQFAAALALAVIGDTPAVEALAGALLDGDETLRKAAAEALALHPEEGHAILRDAMHENDLLTRRAAIWGLKRVGSEPGVMQLLEEARLNDAQWVVRGAAEEALAQLKSPPDLSPRPRPEPDQIGWLVAWAAKLGEGVGKGPAAARSLLRALNDGDPETRIAAAITLGRLGNADAIPDLQAALKSPDADVREAAFEALYQISAATGQRIGP